MVRLLQLYKARDRFLRSHALWYYQDSVSCRGLQMPSVSEGQSPLWNIKSPATPGFPFIGSGTTPTPYAVSQTCFNSQCSSCNWSIRCYLSGDTSQLHSLVSDIGENTLTLSPHHRTLSYSPASPSTMLQNLCHHLSRFLATETQVYCDEEKSTEN